MKGLHFTIYLPILSLVSSSPIQWCLDFLLNNTSSQLHAFPVILNPITNSFRFQWRQTTCKDPPGKECLIKDSPKATQSPITWNYMHNDQLWFSLSMHSCRDCMAWKIVLKWFPNEKLRVKQSFHIFTLQRVWIIQLYSDQVPSKLAATVRFWRKFSDSRVEACEHIAMSKGNCWIVWPCTGRSCGLVQVNADKPYDIYCTHNASLQIAIM